MCHDKQMFALIIAIFLSVVLITGWVFTDRNVMDLITATPFSDFSRSVSAVSDETGTLESFIELPDPGSCTLDGSCG